MKLHFSLLKWLEMVFGLENCSDLLLEKIFLVIKKNFYKFAKYLKIIRAKSIPEVKGKDIFFKP